MNRMEEDADLIIRIGRSIRAKRKAKGWTLATLSRESGLPLNSVARLERGENDPRAVAVIRVAKALCCTVEDLEEEVAEEISAALS